MIKLQKAMTTAFVILGCCWLTSCGNDNGSDKVDINVGSGIILDTAAQSCVDISTVVDPTVPPARSLAAPNLSIRRFQISWKPTDLDLYIGLLRITLTSSKITGGKFVTELSSSEIEDLLGAPGGILTRNTNVDPTQGHVYSSNTPAPGKGSPSGVPTTPPTYIQACALGVGGITLVNPNSTTQFTAQVQIQIIGTAYNSDLSKQETVIKTVNTTATFL